MCEPGGERGTGGAGVKGGEGHPGIRQRGYEESKQREPGTSSSKMEYV